jgi:polysaccharide export outer membrane protein
MVFTAVAALAPFVFSGCAALAPGLHISERDVAARSTPAQPIAIVPITPELLVAQAQQRAQSALDRPKDPLAPAAASYDYKIAALDVLSVTVWDHPELTIPAGEYRAADLAGNPVLADGTMFYPHVGVIPVAGKTVAEVRELLTERLRQWVQNPQLDVRVVAFRGKRVQVTGEVLQPSTLPITDVPMRVQDALAAAKGPTPEAWMRGVTLTRAGEVVRLDLQAFYEDGDVSQNWLLQDGDVLHVPSRQENKVFVLGEVRQPSSKLMAKGHMSLAEAIGDSQGFDPLTSNTAGVYVIRGRYESPKVFRLDASNADALLLAVQFQLEPLDVIYVTPYKLTDWNRVVIQLLPTIQGLWQSYDLAARTYDAVRSLP